MNKFYRRYVKHNSHIFIQETLFEDTVWGMSGIFQV